MNIHELSTYNLADAVKFHRRLNPRIWGRDEHLLPEVREKLLAIAADFQEFLGVEDLDVQDITISGSNAAYSYTKNSDIDLHLVVNMPDNPVYQELFNAKKYQYNDEHNIQIGGADVELYVQPSDQAHHSQGIYSIKNNEWISVPQRKRAQVDDACVRDKTADLDARIHAAVKSKNINTMSTLWNKIKAMRKTGLEQHGEFGCENIAFKMLRNSGCIKLLKDAMTAAQDRELSLREAPRQKFRYGFSEGHQGQPYSSEDGVAASTQMFLNEDDTETKVHDFIQHTATELGLDPLPEIVLHTDPAWSTSNHSFGRYDPESHTLNVSMPNRHILDVLRTVAHELVHCSQHQQHGDLPDDAGETGSRWENDANARAGIIMRDWANTHPEDFEQAPLEEGASGYIPKNKREAAKPQYAMALSVDVHPGQTGKEANKLALHTGRNGEPALLMKTANLRESVNDYLWHGSRHKNTTLVPRQANDTGGAAGSNKNAIYATPSAKVAIAMGLTTPGSETGMFPNDPQMVLFKGGIRKGEMVYLHKVPKNLFINHNGREWYSKSDVKEIKIPNENIVEVPVDKYLNLIRQATPADLELQKKYTQKQDVKEYAMPQPSHGPGKYRDLNEPLGPETPPKMPDGTIKVDVSDMYDWYKLGQKISDLDSIKPGELGAGPPSTVFAFGSEDLENQYSHALTRLGLKTHDLDEPGEEDIDESADQNNKKLDKVLANCCAMVERGQQRDPDRYGMVAACVIDPSHRHVYGINLPGADGRRRHAERVAIDKYIKKHGDIPEGSIIVTTLSPCNSPMDERAGESCKDLLNSVGIHQVYCGYIDPTQHEDEDADFAVGVTQNDELWESCKAFADTFLHEDELEEGWKNALAGAAVAGTMALGAQAKAPDMVQQIVEPGDTVYSIARQNGVNPLEIYKLNKMDRSTRLEVGQKVLVPDYSRPMKPAATVKTTVAPAKAAPVAAPTQSFGDKITSMIPKFSATPAPADEVTLLSNNSEAEAALQTAAKAAGLKGAELAQFMAQTRHESADFGKMKEVGSKKQFAKYEKSRLAKRLGNKVQGDGEKFKGRGFIQLTGRDNYTRASEQIFGDDRLVKNPDLASKLDVAAKIALWYWKNQVRPKVNDFNNTTQVVKAINVDEPAKVIQARHNKFKEYMAVL